ncbi:MAG: hypothetical protein A3A86_00370 [Elusimicrobia bacterium RIFCSPLOWO2_01_FULL_60_11]|nr:MAG: hypothetical protein A3A86_00370 [Elusimicrobia bacterium RIFCSPLOWO2_01_FULL_60_11]
MNEGDKSGREILVVDDDLDLCHVIVDTLTDQGYRATFVETTEDALKKISAKVPDLLLLDLEVPTMGGFVLCQKIHENPATQHLPIIFLSVRDSDLDRKTATGLGADFYISKPFRRSVLLKEVETLLNSSAQAKDDLIGARPPAPLSPTPPPAPEEKPAEMPVAKGWKRYRDLARASLEPRLRALWAWGMANKKKSLPVAAAALFLLGAGTIWTLRHFAKAIVPALIDKGEVSVNVIEAAYAPFQDVLSNVGTIKGGAEIELRFQTEGNIQAINVHDGDAVRTGQVIAVLDQSQSRIKLERAKQEYFRYEKLYALGGVSKDKLDEAKIQLDYAESEINKTVIRASQDGIFGGRDATVGEFVTPQKRIGTVVSVRSVLVSVGVIEKEIDKIFPGQRVIVTVETYPNVEFKGKVETISPIIEGGAKTVEVQARIPNEGKLLLPGMYARTKVVVFESESALAVPNDSVEKTAEGYQVYVVSPEGKAEARPVKVTYVSLVNSVVSEGLSAGEKVIIQKPQDLKAGTPVKVADVEKPISEEAASNAVPGANP